MPKIGRFPPLGKRFFKRVRKLIGSCHFSHFWRVVMALAAIEGRKSLSRISGVCKRRRTRQALSLFLADRVGDLSRAGRVKLVFSRRKSEGSWIALATDETCRNAKTILQNYLSRRPIEVLFKMSKQHLGLGDYQFLRYRAVERYLHLVMIATSCRPTWHVTSWVQKRSVREDDCRFDYRASLKCSTPSGPCSGMTPSAPWSKDLDTLKSERN